MVWLGILCVVFFFIIVILAVRMALLYKGMDEICRGFAGSLKEDTNVLITVSSRDRRIRRLASEINGELRLLRKERRRFQNGDLEVKEAVTNLSHDLRTPLTAIYGYLELLRQEEKSEAVTRYLDRIENRAEAMKQLTEELFRYSVIASSEEKLHLREITVNCALEESISAYYGVLKSRGITPEISMPEQKVVRELDEKALSRIFENVLSNAVKYSREDLSITLKESGEILFSNAAPDLTAVTAGKLFERFYTVETGKNSTGLGLSIARTLTEQMGGRILSDYRDGRLIISIFFPETQK